MSKLARLHRSTGAILPALALLVAGASDCGGKTTQAGGLEIIISTDMPTPANFDTVLVDIEQQAAGSGWRQPPLLQQFYVIPSQITLPTTISIAAGSSPYQEVLITVTGLQGGQAGQYVVQRVVQTQVPTDRVAEVFVVLASVCAGNLNCPTGDSCQPASVGNAAPGTCGANAVDVSMLPVFNSSDVGGAGVASTLDASPADTGAGVDGSRDATTTAMESGASDATTTAMESGAGDATTTAMESGAGDATADGDAAAVSAADATDAVPGATEAGPDSGPDAPTCVDECTLGHSQCISGGVQTCKTQPSGCTKWVTTSTCGTHQACAIKGGTAACGCTASTCTLAGTVCQDAQTVATCTQDADGCLYVASTSSCTMPMSCSGMAPNAGCSLTCSNSCTQGQTTCMAGGLATCTLGANGCWAYAAPVACGARQTCGGTAGTATCSCNTDPTCSAVGMTCASPTSLATCAKDPQGCFYVAMSTTCSNGACSAGACCTNTCTPGEKTCMPGGLATCVQGANGCWAYGAAAACGSRQTCTGAAGAGACTCNTDPVCGNSTGNICPTTSTTATCSVDGQNCIYESASSTCTNQTCVSGQCTGVCAPTQKTCAPDGLGTLSCGITGMWGMEMACMYACVNNACGGMCVPGSVQCANGNTANEICSGVGQWGNPSTCQVSSPACSNGHCAYYLPNVGHLPDPTTQYQNNLYAVRVTPAANTRVARVGFGGGGTTGTLTFGIYSDMGGLPNTLLGSSGFLVNANSNVEGTIAPAVTMTAQTAYWIVGQSDTDVSINANNTQGPGYVFVSYLAYPTMPNTFPRSGSTGVPNTTLNYYLVVQDQ